MQGNEVSSEPAAVVEPDSSIDVTEKDNADILTNTSTGATETEEATERKEESAPEVPATEDTESTEELVKDDVATSEICSDFSIKTQVANFVAMINGFVKSLQGLLQKLMNVLKKG